MVKPGYKRTEIGVLPEDWEVKSFSQVGDYYKGKGISMNDTKTSGFPCIMYGDIYVKFDTHFSHCDYYIDQLTAQQSVKANPEDLFFTASGETAEDIGRCVSYQGTEPIYIGGDIIAIHPYSTYNSLFLSYVQNSVDLKRQKASFAQGHSVVHISSESIKKCKFACPLLPEQKAIATALSDIDSLIDSLEKLIAKKKAIKQGAMQELLTGKRRLPGFSGKWKTVKFGDTNIQVIKGQIITKNYANIGTIPVIAGGKIPAYYTDISNRNGKTITISASGASAGFVNMYVGAIFASDCSTISESKEYNISFVYYLLLNAQNEIYSMQTGGAQPHIHPNDINSLNVFYINDIKEQTAIASILSDMDSEIEQLEKNLSKYKKIKSGMMSELLTGRIRLV